jgi:ribosomal protein L33
MLFYLANKNKMRTFERFSLKKHDEIVFLY